MRRFLIAAILIALSLPATAGAATPTFDPNRPMNRLASNSTGLRATQPDARRLHNMNWGNTKYNTFSDAMASGYTQSQDYNTYSNLRDSLGDGESITVFNTWFLDLPLVQTWGETIVNKPGAAATVTTADGWNYEFVTNAYGAGGTSVQRRTTDSTKRLRPNGVDIRLFSKAAGLYSDNSANGWDASDPDPLSGGNLRFWFWVTCLTRDNPDFYRGDAHGPYSDAPAQQPAAPRVAAAIVPVPAALGLLGLGLIIALVPRIRKHSAGRVARTTTESSG